MKRVVFGKLMMKMMNNVNYKNIKFLNVEYKELFKSILFII